MDTFDDDLLFLVAIPILLFVLAVLGVAVERFVRKRRRGKRRAYHSRSSRTQRPAAAAAKPALSARRSGQRAPAPPVHLEPMPTVPGGLGS